LPPEQIRIVPIADRHLESAFALKARLLEAGLRAEVDSGNERMNAKIRDAELYKIPYIAIVGDKEVSADAVSFRSRKEAEQSGVPVDAFIAHLKKHALARSLEIEGLKLEQATV
jgi:threonyl-tRNA synthetase